MSRHRHRDVDECPHGPVKRWVFISLSGRSSLPGGAEKISQLAGSFEPGGGLFVSVCDLVALSLALLTCLSPFLNQKGGHI